MSTRLSAGGRLIDRTKRIEFKFNGAHLAGYEGDTLASALLANDRMLIGRSFKYHRPRGIVASGPEEPNALVSLREGNRFEPNRRATDTELSDGLVAASQNHWPSLEFDFGIAADLLSRFLPAGFYYKTFIWPQRAWARLYEPAIRNAAGLGRPTKGRDPDRYEHCYAHVDALVVGGGLSGIAAAERLGRSGARVLLLEQSNRWGGRSPTDCADIDGSSAGSWTDSMIGRLRQQESVKLLKRTTGIGVYDHGYVLAVERVAGSSGSSDPLRHRLWRIRAKRIILAAGAIERPICFAGNDVPGVMLASAVRDYLLDYGVSPGDRTVLITNNDDGYKTAIAIVGAGLTVPAILDTRPVSDGSAAKRAAELGIRVELGRAIAAVKGRSPSEIRFRLRSCRRGFGTQ